MSSQLSRRTVLKGLGTALALPLLDAMLPRTARAAAGTSGMVMPRRMAFCYVPNGANMAHWTPSAVGADYELPTILEPLKPFQDDMLVLSNLAQYNANALGDGGGDHARASACFLTGAHPLKAAGADIRAGVSVDQVAAASIGDQTRLPSLELGCEPSMQAGSCDTGYSCAYSSNISWKTPNTPVAKEVNPRLVFERMFGGGDKNEADAIRAKRLQRKTSILDFARDDAADLNRRLGANDRRKVDEYLTTVRELEARIQRQEASRPKAPPEFALPAGIPKEYPEHLKLMCELMALAFQADVTRVSTLVFAHDGSNRTYPSIGVNDAHHGLSHHGGDKDKLAKIALINRFHVTHFAHLLEKLKAVKEGDSTLLDNCMIVYGSGLSDGDRHNHDELPIVLAGRGGGTIKTGRHVKYTTTPLNNLYLAMLERMGVPTATLGDSTGVLANLA